jgi:hypothetical protein
MVGGFSESPYIYDKIKAFTEANGIQAIRPAYASVHFRDLYIGLADTFLAGLL